MLIQVNGHYEMVIPITQALYSKLKENSNNEFI